MEKKRWQFWLIIGALVLTVYNILPTIFYYTKPLSSPVSEKRAEAIAHQALAEVNSLEKKAENWLHSYNKLLGVKAEKVKADAENPQLIQVKFAKTEDAKLFKRFFPRAGALIPFKPAGLALAPLEETLDETVVTIFRQIPIRFDTKNASNYFQYTAKKDKKGGIAPLYKKVVLDRFMQLALAVGGTSDNASLADAAIHHHTRDDFLLILAQNINTIEELFQTHPKIQSRFYSSFSQSVDGVSIDQLIGSFNGYIDAVKLERLALEKKETEIKKAGGYLDSDDRERLDLLKNREERLQTATKTLAANKSQFQRGATPWTPSSLDLNSSTDLRVGPRNPLIQSISLDWSNDEFRIHLHDDIAALRKVEGKSHFKDQLDQLIYNEVARIGRDAKEELIPFKSGFKVALSELTDSNSMLVFDLPKIAEQKVAQVINLINNEWHPESVDLKLPVWDFETYNKLSPEKRQLGLLVYAPGTQSSENQLPSLHTNSIYVIAKGLEQVIAKVSKHPASPQAKQFVADFENLKKLLATSGFMGYAGTTYPLAKTHAKDFIFEEENYFNSILSATREAFNVHGESKYATLEFTNVKQRIAAENKIDNSIHEDLLKWRDEYNSAQVSTQTYAKYDVPAPTQNLYLSNLALSTKKYFRGDERKILHWGLDMMGGKTVQIELRDKNNRVVKEESDIRQGINELFNRVNKMGVSEVSIRQEGNYITLDFPGVQGLSASDLVKASTMYFNIINEKFNHRNREMKDAVNKFLQGVWNEAVVTNRKDIDSINAIAWKHLYGDASDYGMIQPVNEIARILHANGLRLTPPNQSEISSAFNDTASKIAIYRGESFVEWDEQTYPLVIVMRNYAMEGSNLQNIHASYDPQKGNFLSFEVKGAHTLNDGSRVNPRADLRAWSSAFAKEKIQDTKLAEYSNGRGWRMAVILNGSIISAPGLDGVIDRTAMISGSFTQREVSKLEADLKAGSLSFTPHILSEKNISPELGVKERYKGILATVIALVAVILLMSGYYRFAGIIASAAVLLNLLIMWATFQNIQATLTLAGIAGIVLTVGMAVDANVLVFERIREEFAATGRLASSIRAGYSKAFSAILDSNVTTIIAALILLHFDAGPIKGLALTLIIGLVSSMFTALFLTRYFFAAWVKNPKRKELKMCNIIKSSNFNFLKFGKVSIALSVAIILIGGYAGMMKRDTLFGMDFKGGFSLNIDVESKENMNYRDAVTAALKNAGLTSQDFQVQELSPKTNLKLMLSTALDKAGKPFAGMPLETLNPDAAYRYQNNPRIDWVVSTLASAGIELNEKQNLDTNWSIISGQMSDSMRNNALIGLGLALLCIMVYIAFRFEFKYAIAATLGLGIDVFFTVGFLAILHFIGVPVQIDLKIVAGLMTIIGYSLNDTIIIFDRIREDMRTMKKHSLSDIINHALNVTLSRTIMTSSTTLIVLVALIALGGSTIFGLALVMIVGVVYGTFSSLFVAAPLLLYFQRKTDTRTQKLVTSS
ncbi:MAG: Protein translocase subunit SecD [Chlamydiia bacterium]|nr:Protein translocase subunit SecD [Chlamydiia bacterium]MCH9616506.1 Protein translocase subunit SecD [Chlamydiia bacterium]MCH9629508.1 Protein translocase subunit SecD [Chlamydiia bacterium]